MLPDVADERQDQLGSGGRSWPWLEYGPRCGSLTRVMHCSAFLMAARCRSSSCSRAGVAVLVVALPSLSPLAALRLPFGHSIIILASPQHLSALACSWAVVVKRTDLADRPCQQLREPG